MSANEKLRLSLIKATLSLAAQKDWEHLTLLEIATTAKTDLSQLRQEFTSKHQILAAFIRHIDDEVVKQFTDIKADESAKERLFDVIMTRFEVMEPFKPGIKRLTAQSARMPMQAASLLPNMANSHYWMLNASGISADGASALVRIPGLMSIYANVLAIWLEEDDPGAAKTMAALDRRLSRAERWSNRFDGLIKDTTRVFCAVTPWGCRTVKNSADEPVEPQKTDAPDNKPQPAA